jgi:hypothetical protein
MENEGPRAMDEEAVHEVVAGAAEGDGTELD